MTTSALVWSHEYPAAVRALVDAAKKTVSLRTFLLETRPRRDSANVSGLVEALGHAASRGVSVRVLLTVPRTLGVRVPNVASAGLLSALGVDVRLEDSGDHGKCLVVDNDISIVGSHNWTSAAFAASVECSVAVSGGVVATALLDDFEHRWSKADAGFVERVFPELREAMAAPGFPLFSRAVGAGRPAVHALKFVDAREVELLVDATYAERLVARLAAARKSVHVMMYHFSARSGRRDETDTILDALGTAKKGGAVVEVLLDYDDKNDRMLSDVVNQKAFAALQKMGAVVRRDSAKTLMHAKVVVIDDETVFAGSHNWTRLSLLNDGDVSVRVESTALAAATKKKLSAAWSTATPLAMG